MASSSASSGKLSEKMLHLKSKLYEACCAKDINASYTQADLFELDVVEDGDINTLIQLVNRLQVERFFKPCQREGHMAWQVREASDAEKFRGLTSEQAMVYELVEDAGAEGIWSKVVKSKSGLHDTTLRTAFKALEGKRLIMDMKSVQHPTRKMYIKTSIQPSEAVTGGAWFTDGELDEEFIDTICEALYNFIFAKSFYQSSAGRTKKPVKSRSAGKKSTAEIKAARDAALEPQVKLEDAPDQERRDKQGRIDALLPLPPGYQGYPTLIELTRFVDNAKITDAALTQVDIQQLIDILIWDNKIESVISGPAGISYRALRKTAEEMEDGPMNGLTQAPCGKCPVFDLCEEGGPVAPSNCEYFKRWLDPDGY